MSIDPEKAALNAVYAERNALVCALSKVWPSHLALHPDDPEWERDWMHIVCIHAPCGQLTWHIHDSEVPQYEHLEIKPADWDGHSTEEKYRRLAALHACRGCGKALILPANQVIADGCPCNSPRGINHGFVPKDVCTCSECDPDKTGSSRMRVQP